MTSEPDFIKEANGSLTFRFGELVAGAYQLQDTHKPFLHPLMTPKGFKLSLGQPHDHPHHKALMFALQTATHNYWEEYPIHEGDIVGQQLPVDEPTLEVEGNSLSVSHALIWKGIDEAEPQMVEKRTIACELKAESSAFEWTWKTELTPQVDQQLKKSPYVPEVEEGTRINYHGLGIRLRREFGCTGGNQVTVDGEVLPIAEASGKTARAVTFRGSIDEIWPVPKCEVTFASDAPYGLFVIDSPFAYLSYGPTVLETPLWKAGEPITLEYRVRVADVIEN